MLAQMAATAGSVAVGSTIGHGISNMLFGGRGEPAPAQEAQPPVQQQQSYYGATGNCDFQAKGTEFLPFSRSFTTDGGCMRRIHEVS